MPAKTGTALKAKLVRGAYREQELQLWKKNGSEGPPPVRLSKQETDDCYDACLDIVMDKIQADVKKFFPRIGLFLATHNQKSAEHLIERIKQKKLAKATPQGLEVNNLVRKRITIAQLFGESDIDGYGKPLTGDSFPTTNMNDSMTSWPSSQFSSNGEPMVLKYVPYGAFS